MLAELAVRNLGVIAQLAITFEGGMTALTGETGAGKTLVVEALELLVGSRADPMLVRPGSTEAIVEGRFDIAGTGLACEGLVDTELGRQASASQGCSGERLGGSELVLARAVPSSGRSRAWIDGRMAPVAAVAEVGRALVDLHGQHAHQSLLRRSGQRDLLDAFAGLDRRELDQARAVLRDIDDKIAKLDGDSSARAREVDMLRFQVAELDAARLDDESEDERLADEEECLAGATLHRESALRAHTSLVVEGGGVMDSLGSAVEALRGCAPLTAIEQRIRSIQAETAEIAADLRLAAELFEDDPERLGQVRARRKLLHELQRKYGPTLADAKVFATRARERLTELETLQECSESIGVEHERAVVAVLAAETALGEARRAAAPRLASAVESHMHGLAMAKARFEVVMGDDRSGEDVRFLLGVNPGEPTLPLARVVSGGELARTMLAARLVVSVGPPTLVFDEVDAGIGGEAALGVGRALSALGGERQVLVVTHLPQVAAFADHQIVLRKVPERGRTVAVAEPLAPQERVVEISRMMSGQPASPTAREHAEELLEFAAIERSNARERLMSSGYAPSR